MKDYELAQKSLEELMEPVLEAMPVEKRLQGIPPEQRLQGLTPVQLMKAVTALTAEQLSAIAGEMTPEELERFKQRMH
jgi:hypothetical protein